MANKETRVYKSDTLEQFRQKTNDVSLHLGDNEQLNSNLSDKTYNWVDVSAGDLFFKESDDDAKSVRFELKPEETLDNTGGYIILNDSPTIPASFINGATLSQSGGYSATIESVIGQEKILVKNTSGTFNAAEDITDGTGTIVAANIDRLVAESYNIGLVRVYKNGTEISQNLLEDGFHVPNYVASIALSNSPDVSEFTEGSYVYQNGSQLSTLASLQSSSNWYGVVLRASSTELLLKTSIEVNGSFSASSQIRLLNTSDVIAAADHGSLTDKPTSYGVAIELNNEAAANDDIKIFSMDIVAASNELQDDIGVTENLTTTATNLVDAVNEIESVFDASTYEISAGSNNFNVTSGQFTLDSSADIILDADGADVILKDAGSEYGRLTNASGQLQLKSNGSNVFLTANDTNATFNNNLVVEGTLDVDGDFEVGVSKFNVVAASGNTQIDGTLDVDGIVTFDTNTTVGGNLTVNGTTTDLNTTLDVSGVAGFASAVGIDGNFDINTDKFTVAASSGNTVIAGTLSVGSLNTTAQDVRGAINEHQSDIGTVANLTTSATNLTLAINELDLKQGAATLTTSASTLSGAVNELNAGKINLTSGSNQTINSNLTYTTGKTFTFPTGSTLDISDGTLIVGGGAGSQVAFDTAFLELTPNSAQRGLFFERTDYSGSADVKIQWNENQVTANKEARAFQVVGLNDAGTTETADLVTFYNAKELVTNNTESGISVTWDSTNQNFDFNVNDPVITLSGDVSGSATMTNLGNTTISVNVNDVQNNAIALGTKTTGNYVATIAGTTNEIEVTGSGSETAAVTIGLPNNVTITNNLNVNGNTVLGNATTDTVSIAGDLTITGDLTVNGTETILNTTTLEVEDTLVLAGNNLVSEPSSGGFGLEVGPITSPSGVAAGVTGAHSIVYNYATDQWEADGSLILSSATLSTPQIEGANFGPGDNLTFTAGSGLSESVAGFAVTYTNTDRGSSQNIFKNVASDSGTAVADSNNDTLTLTGGNAISTSVSGDTVTIAHDDTSTLNGTYGGANNGIVIEDITVDSNGHVQAVGTIDLDGRFYQQSQFLSTNTASAPVIRDGSGNFAAGTITATLSGTATNANNVNIDEKNDNVNYQVLFSGANATGYERPYIDTDDTHFLYNPSTHTLTAGTFSGSHSGNGSGLTSLNASNISSGTISDARLPNSITSDITGNAATATVLQTARTIGGVSFNGSANINLPGVNTSGNQNTSGNAATATKLATARNIALTGAVTGNANFDGSGNISISTSATSDPTLTINGDASGSATFTNLGSATLTLSIVDDSHNHIISNIDGLQGALDAKGTMSNWNLQASGGATTSITNNGTVNFTGSGATSVSRTGNTITISSTDNNTTYSVGDGGLTQVNFTTTRRDKLDGIAANANNYSFPYTITSSNTGSTVVFRDGSGNFSMGALSCTSVSASGDVVAYATSDERLKDNITLIENSLEKVGQLKGYEFDWNDKQDIYIGHDIGVIAQEVEKVAPELVQERDDGYKAVKYEKLVPLLINAINELKAEIEELKDINKKV